MKQPYNNAISSHELMKLLPEIEYQEKPEYEKLYKFAWQSAYDHIKCCSGAPQSPFMDEAFAEDRIWIWDTCFMALYCKYAPNIFPGVESLENFYKPMLDNAPTELKVQVPDNPPLFAWVEYENYLMTGNRKRLDEVFFKKKYIQRMFELFENFKYGQKFEYTSSIYPIQWEKTRVGYHWTGGRSGMDNTPRGDNGTDVYDNDEAYRNILFVDAIAQQALSAKIIYEATGEDNYRSKHQELCYLLNEYYWNEEDGLYYDIEAESPHKQVKVKTPASFWPLLADACSPKQVEKLARNAADPNIFGGEYPFPSVSRDSVHYEPEGRYWRGGIWMPTTYMSIKALERNGHRELANELAERVVYQQFVTWQDFTPHTIWEAYSPSEAKPSNGKFEEDGFVRPDFCGWSALGPICLFIENILGIQADGVNRVIDWDIHNSKPHGIKNLRFANITTDIRYENGTVSVITDKKFTLRIKNKFWKCEPGESTFKVKNL